MQMGLNNGFCEMSQDEVMAVEGGFVLSGTLFTIFGVAITGKMCLAAGATVGLAAGTVVLDHIIDQEDLMYEIK